jgi:hypothetical protein
MAHPHIVNRLSRDKRNQFLQKSFTLGDQVKQDRRNPDVWLVSSSTHANVWYRVKDGRSCGCAWFARTGAPCRHLVRVSWELHQLRKQRKEEAIA